MFAVLKSFFAKVQGSVPGVLVPEELYRSILTSLGSGTISGLAVLILQAILTHVAAIFPDPTVATLVTFSLTLVLDLLRRQSHGDQPARAFASAEAPAASIAPASAEGSAV